MRASAAVVVADTHSSAKRDDPKIRLSLRILWVPFKVIVVVVRGRCPGRDSDTRRAFVIVVRFYAAAVGSMRSTGEGVLIFSLQLTSDLRSGREEGSENMSM